MLGMIASLQGFTQTDSTRLVGVKAYKLGYLIRDAQLFRLCDSTAFQLTKSLKDKTNLVAGLDKEISSLKKENVKLQKADSVSAVRYDNAQELYQINKQELKTKLKRRNKVILGEAGIIVVLLFLLL
jgi:hypothetical protein